MFGRRAREQRELEEQARKERQQAERDDYWKRLFDGAKDGNESLRLHMAYQQELLFDWLKDFDRRVGAEMRQHAEANRLMLLLVLALLVTLWWR